MKKLLLVLAAMMMVGCGQSSGSSKDGYWYGVKVSFQVEADTITDLTINKIWCELGGCEAAAGDVSDVNYELTTESFNLTAQSGDGTLVLTGSFNGELATGTYKFTSECCTKEGTWNAQHYDAGLAPDTAQDTAQDLYFEDPAGIAIDQTNALRAQLGLQPVIRDAAIETAAQAHAEYFSAHCEQYQTTGLSPHKENMDWQEGFYGTNFWNRLAHAGFEGDAASEIMAFNGNPYQAVDDWLFTLYHRLPLVSPKVKYAGFGITYECCLQWSHGVDVMDFGAAETPEELVVMYPWDGQTDVPLSWDGLESPEPPMPVGFDYPSGPIVTLTLPYKDFTAELHELLDPDGEPVPHQFVTPANDPAQVLSDTVSLYSLEPLAKGLTYTVRIQIAPKDSDPELFEWSFTTVQ